MTSRRSSSTASAASASRRSSAPRTRCRPRLATRFGVARGDRVAVLSANNPEWCLSVLGHRRPRRHPGRAQRLVEDRRDPLRPRGLGRQGAGGRCPALRAGGRRRRSPAASPTLEAVLLIDAEPEQFGGGPLLHRFDELTGAPTDEFPDRPDRRGRPRGDLLHERHDRPAEGRHLHPPQHDRQPAEHDLQHGRRLDGRRGAAIPSSPADEPDAAGPTARPAQQAALFTSPLFHVSGCHSSLVVGLLAALKLVMPVGRFDPEQALELIQRERVTVWATVPTMVWRVCEHPDRHRYDTSSVVSVAFGGSPSADELQRKVRETFPNVTHHVERLRPHRVELGGHGDLRARTPIERPWSVGRPMPVVELTHRRRRRQRASRPGRPARSSSRARSSCPATGTSPRPRRPTVQRRLAAHRRHRLRSTPTGSSPSPIGRRT